MEGVVTPSTVGLGWCFGRAVAAMLVSTGRLRKGVWDLMSSDYEIDWSFGAGRDRARIGHGRRMART
jgi:hypothetical protein